MYKNSPKNSSSDLHSRLKTRKLLGVGETNGARRSKISQILGFDENLFVKLPKGLVFWQVANMLYIFITGLLCSIFPSFMVSLELPAENAGGSGALRLYGTALIGFVFLMAQFYRNGKTEISAALISCAVLFGLQAAANLISTLQALKLSSSIILVISVKLFLAAGNICYHDQLNPQSGFSRKFCGMRRGSSSIWPTPNDATTTKNVANLPSKKENVVFDDLSDQEGTENRKDL